MKLLTKEIEKQLPALYATEDISKEKKKAVVKFFSPWSNWTWYGIEYDPEEKLFYGYVVGQSAEYGYFTLDELSATVGPGGLKIERDLYFKPTLVSEIVKKVA